MENEERVSLYRLWQQESEYALSLEEAAKNASSAGEAAFQALREADIEAAYDAGDAAGWVEADRLQEELVSCKQRCESLYEQLEKNPFPRMSEFESCWRVGHTTAKKVEVEFLDGSKRVGYVSPWEGDYCGGPYYFRDEDGKYSEYLDEGWNVKDVRLLEVEKR